MVLKSISLESPFPDTCGWNQAMEYESSWHLEEALKKDQSTVGCGYHLVATFIYNLPLINFACYTMTYVFLAVIRPDWLEKTEGKARAHFEKRRGFQSPKPKNTIRKGYHDQMDQIFRRQEKKHVLLLGPPGVGKTKIGETYPGQITLIDHFEKMEFSRLASILKTNHTPLVLCSRSWAPHKELLERYCTPIAVKEPSDEETKKIVKGRFPTVSDEVLDQALELCHFYLPNQCQPALLFDLIDQTFAFNQEVTLDQLKKVLGEKMCTPIRTPEERTTYYASAERTLKEKVLGQDHVIAKVAQVLENCGRGHWPTGVPIFHFAGPSGVGKTELAKAIGTFFYESDNRFLHVSMSQYGEKHFVSALLGTTPGYVGFEKGGQIQEKAKEGPFVLLLDEVDKAHPDVMTTLIQHVAEEGTLYDPKTQSDVSLKGCIIILTSNLGASELKAPLSSPEEVEKLIKPAIENHFRKELINRLHTLYFTPHTDEEVVRQIVIKILKKEQKQHRCTLTWTDEYVNAFTNMEKIQKEGVRWIRRSIEGSLRNQILRGNYHAGQRIKIDWNNRVDVITLME